MDKVPVAQIPMEMAGQSGTYLWSCTRRQKQEDMGDLLASLGSQ